MSILQGKKTYIAAAGLILTGIYNCIEGNYEVGIESILAGLGFLGLRAAK
jgi:hypothetical protein|tara:strand:+ start:635 stop:784 length:150 start_codon:yes stop_codon:yes gene_type:complete